MAASVKGREAIEAAIARVPEVRSVGVVHIAEESGRLVIAARIGLSPALGLQEVVGVIARVQLAAGRLVPAGTAVVIEPDVAADRSTPAEAIVIRGFE